MQLRVLRRLALLIALSGGLIALIGAATSAQARSEIRVNGTRAGDQNQPAIAALGDNSFVVVWRDATTGIQGRRLQPNGLRQGDEFQVSASGESPAVAPFGDGFVVVWAAPDGSLSGIFGQIYDAAGVKIGDTFPINTFTSGNQSGPAVAALADGGFVVAWTSMGQDGDFEGVFAQRYDADGLEAGDEFQVNTAYGGGQFSPAIAGLKASDGGGFVIVWDFFVADLDVAAQIFAADGTKVGGEFWITGGGQQSGSSVAAFDGGFVVVWSGTPRGGSDDYNIYGQRYTAAGAQVGSRFRINGTMAGNQFRPDVAARADGAFVVVWHVADQDGSGDGVYGRRFAADGSKVRLDFQVNVATTDDQNAPVVAVPPSGNGFVAVWVSRNQDGSGDGVYSLRFNRMGQ
jgi:hypothetical protein